MEYKPPDYNFANDIGYRMSSILNQYNINHILSEKLSTLKKLNIVILVDDSTSMLIKDNKNCMATRWDKLRHILSIIITIASLYSDSYINIRFLNNNNNNISINNNFNLNSIFNFQPNGHTPLLFRLQEIFNSYINYDNKTLIIIATDGIPTDEYGVPNTKKFKKILKNISDKFLISFIACSNDIKDIGYLFKINKKNVNTLFSDYNTELNKITKNNIDIDYQFGDHICRIILGSIYQELNNFSNSIINCNIF